jgi:hypothetical protein
MKIHKRFLTLFLASLAGRCHAGQAESTDALLSAITSLSHANPNTTFERLGRLDAVVADTSFFLAAQYAPAQLSNTFPTIPPFSPVSNLYKLKVCEKHAITDCMPYGVFLTPKSVLLANYPE